jgi:hypothetical protein
MSSLHPKCQWSLDPRKAGSGLSGRVVRRDGTLVCPNQADWVISDGDRIVYVCSGCLDEAKKSFPRYAEVAELKDPDDC